MDISEYIVCFIVGFIALAIILGILGKIYDFISSSIYSASWEAEYKRRSLESQRKWEIEQAKRDKIRKAEHDAREQERELARKREEAEADKLVSKFKRSELTELIIKEATATDGTVMEIRVQGSRVTFKVAQGGEKWELQVKEGMMYYRDYGFESLDAIQSLALAKAIAQKLGNDYEYAGLRDEYDCGYWLVRYRHMDKLEPKLRSPI